MVTVTGGVLELARVIGRAFQGLNSLNLWSTFVSRRGECSVEALDRATNFIEQRVRGDCASL